MQSAFGIWGDSIMKGVIFDSQTRKYKLLKESAAEIFSRSFSIPVRNHSRFGGTAPRARTQLLQSLETKGVPEIVLLELGGNDCDYPWRQVSKDPLSYHSSNTPIDLFKKIICDMFQIIRSAGGTPVTMSLPPIHAERYFDFITSDAQVDGAQIMTFLGEKQQIYRRQELYSAALCRIAGAMDVPIVDVRSHFLGQPLLSDYLCIDGIHPNEKGQKLISEVFTAAYASFRKRK